MGRTQTWKKFSEYIRRRDGGVCFTCGRRGDWKYMHAGHFLHGGTTQAWGLDYDERNVNCQCVECNTFKSGNRKVYQEKLIRKYGEQIVDELYAIKEYRGMVDKEAIEKRVNELYKGLDEY
jgi:hypothetical protein